MKTMNKNLLIIISIFLSLALVSASVVFAVIYVTTTVSVGEPISPLSTNVEYIFPAHSAPVTVVFNSIITNAASSDIPINITFTETLRHPSCTGVYESDTPKIINLISGPNIIATQMTCVSGQCGGCWINGIINIARI